MVLILVLGDAGGFIPPTSCEDDIICEDDIVEDDFCGVDIWYGGGGNGGGLIMPPLDQLKISPSNT